jgi:hypothetical protein
VTALLWAIAILLVVAGVLGTVFPALPGPPLVFAGLVLAAWIDGFQKVGWLPLFVLALLTAASIAIDLVAGVLGAKRVGASRPAVIGASLGTLGGLFFGLPGLLVGPFLGALAGELAVKRDLGQAAKVGVAAWLGFLFGAFVKVGLVFAMVAVFVTAYVV